MHLSLESHLDFEAKQGLHELEMSTGKAESALIDSERNSSSESTQGRGAYPMENNSGRSVRYAAYDLSCGAILLVVSPALYKRPPNEVCYLGSLNG